MSVPLTPRNRDKEYPDHTPRGPQGHESRSRTSLGDSRGGTLNPQFPPVLVERTPFKEQDPTPVGRESGVDRKTRGSRLSTLEPEVYLWFTQGSVRRRVCTPESICPVSGDEGDCSRLHCLLLHLSEVSYSPSTGSPPSVLAPCRPRTDSHG